MTELPKKEAYYPFVLDQKPGFFLSWVLYILFKHVRFPPEMAENLRQMHRQGTVVYAIKYRSHIDYLLYHYRFRSSRLPYPKIAFDMNISAFLPVSRFMKILKFQIRHFLEHREIPDPFKTGFYRESIQQGTSALLCLVDPKGFLRHFIFSEKDHIHFLLECQKDMDRPIFVVPQLILYKKTPEKDHPSIKDIFFGYKDNPGFIRRIALFFRHNRRAFIDFGSPLNLKEILDEHHGTRSMEELAVEIKQMLIDGIDLQKRVILGPVMKTRQQQKEKVLRDSDVIHAIEKRATGTHKSLKEIRKEADKIFNEIAADYNITYIQLFYMILTWLFKKLYQGIDTDPKELSVVREWARKGPLVYVPSHKSHVDYLVLNYVLFQNHMHIPRVAAGQNLSFWPMGYIFRKSGAFFIRRAFRGASLYQNIFARYIKQLLQEGHPLEFFIEGGRSRSGKLILPKTGFLSILLRAFEEGYSKDLAFVPVSISYDTVLEEKSYIKELSGAEKETESLIQMLNARRFLSRKYGKIYIRFGPPIALKEYLAQNELIPQSAGQPLAFDLTKSINRATLVTPLAVVSISILTRHRKGFHKEEIFDTAKSLVAYLDHYQIPKAPSLNHLENTLDETLSLLVNKKIIDQLKQSEAEEVIYYVNQDNMNELEYYKNNVIHFFIVHSFVAAALLRGTEDEKTFDEIYEDVAFLRDLFKNEFVYDQEEDIRSEIRRALDYFLNAFYIMKDDRGRQGYMLSRRGYDELPVWANLSKTFLESYWVAVRTYLQKGDMPKKKADQIKHIRQLGEQYHRLGFIDHTEGISRISFENATRLIHGTVSNVNVNSDEKSAEVEMEENLRKLNQRIHDLSNY